MISKFEIALKECNEYRMCLSKKAKECAEVYEFITYIITAESLEKTKI